MGDLEYIDMKKKKIDYRKCHQHSKVMKQTGRKETMKQNHEIISFIRKKI